MIYKAINTITCIHRIINCGNFMVEPISIEINFDHMLVEEKTFILNSFRLRIGGDIVEFHTFHS